MELTFTPPAAFHIKAMAAMLWDITVNLILLWLLFWVIPAIQVLAAITNNKEMDMIFNTL